MTRPTKIQNWMDQADVVSRRSHDAETKVGAILIKNSSHSVVAEGFNGFIRGAPDNVLPNTRPDKYPYILHAEHNLITNCARHGVSMEDSTLVCTLTPCVLCMRLLWQCGITKVIARTSYRDFEELTKMKDLRIDAKMTPEGFLSLTYGVRHDQDFERQDSGQGTERA